MRSDLLEMLARTLFLPMLVLSMAFLVKGYHSPGGGFAAGAIGAVAFVLQRLVFGHGRLREMVGFRVRELALIMGLGSTLCLTALSVMRGAAPLTHHPPPGEHLWQLGAIDLHTSLVFEAGVYLLVFAFVLEAVSLVAPDEDEES